MRHEVNAWRHDALEVPGVYAQLRVWRHTPVATLKPTQRAVLLKGCLGSMLFLEQILA